MGILLTFNFRFFRFSCHYRYHYLMSSLPYRLFDGNIMKTKMLSCSIDDLRSLSTILYHSQGLSSNNLSLLPSLPFVRPQDKRMYVSPFSRGTAAIAPLLRSLAPSPLHLAPVNRGVNLVDRSIRFSSWSGVRSDHKGDEAFPERNTSLSFRFITRDTSDMY